jgi:hypothetical protein
VDEVNLLNFVAPKITAMKLITLLLCALVFLICTASTCNPPFDHAYAITVTNNSPHNIQYITSYNYPDTTIPGLQNQLITVGVNNSTFIDSKEEWGSVISKTPGGKMSFFFFSPDTIAKYGWPVVVSNYLVLTRKDLSAQDIKAMGNIVTYP